MSSFDQSRGFARQDSYNASDGWGNTTVQPSITSPPFPTSSSLSSNNGFQSYAHTAAHDLNQPTSNQPQLDYSLIDAGSSPHSTHPFGHDLALDQPVEWQLEKQHTVHVHLKPTLEGSLLQKHHVWVVVSDKTSTERRYSDFVWLLDCLLRRYPFRLLPTLPPKSIQYQGHFIGQDDGFLERRKHGLERCLNHLINHPVLKLDAIVVTFLNEQSDLTSYRKQTSLSLSEESSTTTLSTSQLSRLPVDLDHRFSQLRSRLPAEIDLWTKVSITCDRIAHRRLNQSVEWMKLGSQFDQAARFDETVAGGSNPNGLAAEGGAGGSVNDLMGSVTSSVAATASGAKGVVSEGAKRLLGRSVSSASTAATTTNGKTRPPHENGRTTHARSGSIGGSGGASSIASWRPKEMKQLDRDFDETKKSIEQVGEREEASAKRLLGGWVEDVKRHRELYTNLRDLFHRQVTLGIDHVDKLQKRVDSNTSKLNLLQSTTPAPPTYNLDHDKLTSAIESDKRTIETLKRRREFIRWCVWEEIQWVFRCTSLMRISLKEFAQQEQSFVKGIGQVWESLEEQGLR